MDGIDGFAGGEAAVASSFFFLVFSYYGESGWAVANLVVAAASMGFVLPFANFILDTTFTLFRRLIRREKWYQAHRSHFYQRMTDLGMTLHPGRSCGADRFGGFGGRGDRLRRSLGIGQGTCGGSAAVITLDDNIAMRYYFYQ
jgi:UDP-N-acetylmuramyl pentapeptide phosphotransferase/UDP-N-acetylglucosamine-1-phosphate transferase